MSWICLAFVWNNTNFVFQDQIYEQCFGTDMGSPASPIIASIYIKYIEQKAIKTCTQECKPDMWYRYINGIIESRQKDQVQNPTGHQVDKTSHINFTVETEENKVLPVLDLKATRQPDGKKQLQSRGEVIHRSAPEL